MGTNDQIISGNNNYQERQTKCRIEFNNVMVRWPSDVGNVALANVTFKVHAGQLLTVIGPIGSGKVITQCFVRFPFCYCLLNILCSY